LANARGMVRSVPDGGTTLREAQGARPHACSSGSDARSPRVRAHNHHRRTDARRSNPPLLPWHHVQELHLTNPGSELSAEAVAQLATVPLRSVVVEGCLGSVAAAARELSAAAAARGRQMEVAVVNVRATAGGLAAAVAAAGQRA
jgi:hypothetical protein